MANIKEKCGEYGKLLLTLRKQFIGKIDKQVEILDKHVHSIITALGVVAGFGFTAVSNVKHIYFFVAGEFLTVVPILYLLWFFTNDYLDGLRNTKDTLTEFEKNNTRIKKALVENREDEQLELANEFDALIQNTDYTPDPSPTTNYYSIRLNIIFFFTIFGIIFLLLSFIPSAQKLARHDHRSSFIYLQSNYLPN